MIKKVLTWLVIVIALAITIPFVVDPSLRNETMRDPGGAAVLIGFFGVIGLGLVLGGAFLGGFILTLSGWIGRRISRN